MHYQPAPSDEVVIYTHRFKAEEFEKGVKRVEEGFTQAQKALGQTRLNYFLVSPSNYEVVVVSFFSKETSVEEWHKICRPPRPAEGARADAPRADDPAALPGACGDHDREVRRRRGAGGA